MSAVATLPVEALSLCRALGRGKALVPIDSLPKRFAMTEEDAAAALAELVSLNLVEVWEPAEGRPSAVLSVAACAALGLELATDDRNRHHWVKAGNGTDGALGKPTGNGVPLDPE